MPKYVVQHGKIGRLENGALVRYHKGETIELDAKLAQAFGAQVKPLDREAALELAKVSTDEPKADEPEQAPAAQPTPQGDPVSTDEPTPQGDPVSTQDSQPTTPPAREPDAPRGGRRGGGR